MRFLLLVIVCAISSCNQEPKIFSSEVNFNIKGGFYEEMQVNTWEGKSSVCASLAIVSAHTETQWRPAVGLNVSSEDGKYTAHIQLVAGSSDTTDLQVVYRLVTKDVKKQEHVVIKKNIPLGEAVNVEIFFTENNGLGVQLDNAGQVFDLPFEPKFLAIFGSSAKSQVKINTESCEAQAEKSQSSSAPALESSSK